MLGDYFVLDNTCFSMELVLNPVANFVAVRARAVDLSSQARELSLVKAALLDVIELVRGLEFLGNVRVF